VEIAASKVVTFFRRAAGATVAQQKRSSKDAHYPNIPDDAYICGAVDSRSSRRDPEQRFRLSRRAGVGSEKNANVRAFCGRTPTERWAQLSRRSDRGTDERRRRAHIKAAVSAALSLAAAAAVKNVVGAIVRATAAALKLFKQSR